jgi:hypothetical protein
MTKAKSSSITKDEKEVAEKHMLSSSELNGYLDTVQSMVRQKARSVIPELNVYKDLSGSSVGAIMEKICRVLIRLVIMDQGLLLENPESLNMLMRNYWKDYLHFRGWKHLQSFLCGRKDNIYIMKYV